MTTPLLRDYAASSVFAGATNASMVGIIDARKLADFYNTAKPEVLKKLGVGSFLQLQVNITTAMRVVFPNALLISRVAMKGSSSLGKGQKAAAAINSTGSLGKAVTATASTRGTATGVKQANVTNKMSHPHKHNHAHHAHNMPHNASAALHNSSSTVVARAGSKAGHNTAVMAATGNTTVGNTVTVGTKSTGNTTISSAGKQSVAAGRKLLRHAGWSQLRQLLAARSALQHNSSVNQQQPAVTSPAMSVTSSTPAVTHANEHKTLSRSSQSNKSKSKAGVVKPSMTDVLMYRQGHAIILQPNDKCPYQYVVTKNNALLQPQGTVPPPANETALQMAYWAVGAVAVAAVGAAACFVVSKTVAQKRTEVSRVLVMM